MKYKVTIDKSFTETRYGIEFVRGEGYTDNEALAKRLKAKGFQVDLIETSKPKK